MSIMLDEPSHIFPNLGLVPHIPKVEIVNHHTQQF